MKCLYSIANVDRVRARTECDLYSRALQEWKIGTAAEVSSIGDRLRLLLDEVSPTRLCVEDSDWSEVRGVLQNADSSLPTAAIFWEPDDVRKMAEAIGTAPSTTPHSASLTAWLGQEAQRSRSVIALSL